MNEGSSPTPQIGPPPANFELPPTPPPVVDKTPVFRPIHVGAAAVVLLTAALPIYLAFSSATFRAAGLAGFSALFLGLLSLVLGIIRLSLAKKRPTKMGFAMLAALLGGVAVVIGALAGHLMRGAEIQAGDLLMTVSMREYLSAQADLGARRAALLGLVGVPGAILGFLLVVMVLGARRSLPAAKQKEPMLFWPLWLGIFGTAAMLLPGIVAAIWAAVLPVPEVVHPNEQRVVQTAEALHAQNLKVGCEGLELALSRGYITDELLEKHLPDRYELSHRCVTWLIDSLPKGEGCPKAAEALAETHTVALAQAEKRVAEACKR